jgi:hypothetical protein
VDELALFPLPGDGTDGFVVRDGFAGGVEGLPTILIWIAVADVVFVLAEGIVWARVSYILPS